MTARMPMIRKIVTVLILLPVALLIVMFAVANRGPVTIALDPFGGEPPMFTGGLAAVLLLLPALDAGVIGGRGAGWAGQRKWRRRGRRVATGPKARHVEAAALRRRLETASPVAQPQPQTFIAGIAY